MQVMLIMGGSGSVGRAVADRALSAGWAVILHGRSPDTVEAICQQLRKQYPTAVVRPAVCTIDDTTDFAHLLDQLGLEDGLDAVVDCVAAGPKAGGISGSIGAVDPLQLSEFMSLSAVYTQKLAAATLPRLRNRRGCLITFVSDAGRYPAPNQAIIGAARAATIGFIRNLALEVARDGVRAHCISLSYVEDSAIVERLDRGAGRPRVDKARARAGLGLPSPDDIAPLVLFLCGEGAQRMTGQVMSINGGLNT